MRERCESPKARYYHRYGGRGISVCERWLKFENFLADMGERPPRMSLDRFPNNDGNYEPGNCRWATNLQQHRNKSSNRLISHEGETLTVTEWAERFGIQRAALYERLKRGYIPPELFMKNTRSMANTRAWKRRKAI